MILKASERGGGKQLAMHLLNDTDNEHVNVHEIRGFVSDDVVGAFKEAYAISKGTKCKNFLFSVSLSPPEHEDVPVSVFENTLERIEARTGLTGQPRVVVFHEKNGRRHAHCVWNRIDADTMTARNLSHFKNKLQDISRDLYHEHDWKMPQGLARGKDSDPRNFNLAEWQQCKRMGKNARDVKARMQDCWAMTDSAVAFKHALSERGMILAKGDRRGHVAVTHEGEVLSVARYVSKKAKNVRARLGEPKGLPSVEDAKAQIAQDMRANFTCHAEEAKGQRTINENALEARRNTMVMKHRAERQRLKIGQETRWQEETKQRSARINAGLKGLWQRVSGQRRKTQLRNEQEAFASMKRDHAESDMLIRQQLQDRRALQKQIKMAKERSLDTLHSIREDQKHYKELEAPSIEASTKKPEQPAEKYFSSNIKPSPSDYGRLEQLKNKQGAQNHRDRGYEFER
ncbi:MAG: relaxase [Rhizobiales bacterium]|nr:relaxase [Hyphomicrobiales bacterium]